MKKRGRVKGGGKEGENGRERERKRGRKRESWRELESNLNVEDFKREVFCERRCSNNYYLEH